MALRFCIMKAIVYRKYGGQKVVDKIKVSGAKIWGYCATSASDNNVHLCVRIGIDIMSASMRFRMA